MEQTYHVSEKLKSIEKRLDTSDFVRCHISYLCSLSQVLELRRTELLLRGGQLIPVSRNRYNDVKQSLARHLGGAL